MKDKWKILYLGLDPTRFSHAGTLVHYPLIRIQPRPWESLRDSFRAHATWTHILFTSQTSVSIFFAVCLVMKITPCSHFIAVGKATQAKLQEQGAFQITCAENECAEGVVDVLKSMDLKNAHLFFPHSALSRTTIVDFLKENGISHSEAILYEPQPQEIAPRPKIQEFDEIVFTSPSVVDAYISIFGPLPVGKRLTAIGPITQKRMDHFLE
jgi:uroporphyrinogen-III synthase